MCVCGVGVGVDSIALFPLWDVNFSGGSGIGEPAAAPSPLETSPFPSTFPLSLSTGSQRLASGKQGVMGLWKCESASKLSGVRS